MEIKIKYHNSELEKLRSLSVGDWIDLRAAERVELKAGEFRLISLGVSMKLPEGYEAHIAPRSSSFAKWGFLQVNSVGVVDNSYAGTNDIWKLPVYATRDAVIEVNDRICQFRIMERMPQIVFTEVDALDDADRGGFGSTGVR
jgi:dUTP pyrophosphatase